MILKSKAHIFSQLMQFVQYLPNSQNEREFKDQELLSKLFFYQVTGHTYEDFISAYYAYPSVIAKFQAECLVEYNLEINVEEPKLTSTFQRDADGEINHGFVKFRIPIRITSKRYNRSDAPNEFLYVDLDIYTPDVDSKVCSSSPDDLPRIQLVMHSLEDTTGFDQRPSMFTEHFFGRDAMHYARSLRTAVYTVVRDYVEQVRPEIFNGKPRSDTYITGTSDKC